MASSEAGKSNTMTPKTYTHHFDTPLYKKDVTINTGLFINNEFVEPVKGQTVDVVNPSTGQVITKFPIGTKEDVDKAVDAAEKAFKTSWGLKVPGQERAKLMNKFADICEARLDELAAIESLNAGKPFFITQRYDVATFVACIRYYAGWADKIQGETNEGSPEKFTYAVREPYGVCGEILPWNFPLDNMSWKIGPALATGNTMVLKPSEVTPLSAQLICECIREAGFPPGVFNVVTGYGNEVGQAITEHPRIWNVAFTGSTIVGRKVLEAAAKSNLKKVTLELGGKGPSLIFDDADLVKTVKWCIHGGFYNTGQCCTQGSRLYIQEGIFEKFVEAFSKASKEFGTKSGDPFDLGVKHGPQTSKNQFNKVMSYVEGAKKIEGALLCGGDRIGKTEGFFIHPTLFQNIDPEMEIARDEVFGPVLTVHKFKTEEEAINLANDTLYGLSASIFTENLTKAIRVSRAIEAGTIWVNMANWPDVNTPFGGYKQSGFGRELGKVAIDSYTQYKGVHVNLGTQM